MILPAYVDLRALEERLGDAGASMMQKKYLPRDKKGETVGSPAERCYAVAAAVGGIERRYGGDDKRVGDITRQFYEAMASLDFLPGGRVLANAGTDIKALANCYALPVPDDLEEIYQVLKEAAIIHKNGGGTGYNFSKLRPRGSRVKNGVASGPVSFGTQYDKETEVINSGNRRGANMGILNIDHPDIFEFIRAKFQYKKLTNFNVSVGVTDEFMVAFMRGGYYSLRFGEKEFTKRDIEEICTNIERDKAGAEVGRKPEPASLAVRGNKVYNIYPVVDDRGNLIYGAGGEIKTKREEVGRVGKKGYILLDARKVMEIIARHAHSTGEPGILFLDRIEEGNMLKTAGRIDTTNPCGEQPLHPYDACNLGSINLGNMTKRGDGETKVDYEKLERVTRLAVRFLDNVNDLSEGPIKKIEETMRRHRRLGLGVMGWADMLASLRIAYDSEEAFGLAEKVMGDINTVAKSESVKLAEERGVFPEFEDSSYDKKNPAERFRNLARTTIAPTGTISMVAGVNGGIEPYFGLIVYKKMRGGDTVKILNPEFLRVVQEAGLNLGSILKQVEENRGSCQRIREIPPEIRRVFRTAMDITPEAHIRMQASFQRHVDNAISKTINLPNDATVKDVLNAYVAAYKMKCKGITVYRDGSRPVQVLELSNSEKPAEVVYNAVKPRPRPEIMDARVYTIRSGCGRLFVSISHDDEGRIVDIFANPHGEGGCTSNLNALTIMASKAVRAGVCIEDIVDALSSHTCPTFMVQREKSRNGGGKLVSNGKSCPDAIRHILDTEVKRLSEMYPATYKGKKEKKKKTEVKIDPNSCPDCGAVLLRGEGCLKCPSCGFSKC